MRLKIVILLFLVVGAAGNCFAQALEPGSHPASLTQQVSGLQWTTSSQIQLGMAPEIMAMCLK